MAKRAEKGRVHPDCINASNPYHECTDYCFKIIAEPKKRMDKNDAGTSISVFEEDYRSMAKSAEKGRVHPDCRNASNPYHECTAYCFKIIAEPKKRMKKSDAGTGVSVFEEENRSMAKSAEEGRVHPDCRNSSNPYHECTEYCFKIIAKAEKDCRNSSNPYHECTEYCLKIIAEAKNKMIKSDAGLQASNCIVQTDMVTGTIQLEDTIDGCEEHSDEESGAYADIAAMYFANLTGR